MADDIVRSLITNLELRAESFNNGLKVSQREAKAFEKNLQPTLTLAKDLGTAMAAAGAAVAGGMLVAAKAAIDYGDALNDARQRTGVAVGDLSKLGFAAEQSGSSFEGLSTGLKFLSKNMEAATGGSKAQKAAFAALGISAKDLESAHGDANKVLLMIADRFKELPDGAEKSALSMQIFGKSGTDLIPMLNEGSAGISKLGDDAQRLGLVMSNETALASDALNDTLNEVKGAALGASIGIATALLPSLQRAADLAVEGVSAFGNFVKEHQGLATATAGAAGLLLGTGTALGGLAIVVPKVQQGFALLQSALLPVGIALTGVMVAQAALAVGIGVGIGLLTNWAIEGTFVEKSLDRLTGSIQSQIIYQGSMLDTTTKAAAVLKDKYAVAIDRGNSSIEEWNKQVTESLLAHQKLDPALQANIQRNAELRKGHDEMRGALEDVLKSIDKNEKAQKSATEASDKFNVEVKAITDSFNKETLAAPALVAAIKQLTDANVPAAAITDKLGKDILATRDALELQGKAVPPLLATWADYVEGIQLSADGSKIAADMAKDLTANTKTLADGVKEAGFAFQTLSDDQMASAIEAMAAAALEQGDLDVAIRAGYESVDLYSDKWTRFRELLGQPMPEITFQVDDAKKAAAEAAATLQRGKEIVDDIADGITKMFMDGISHGKSFWEAFKDLGMNAVAAITSSLLDTMIKEVLGQWKKQFGEWQKDFSEFIGKHANTIAMAVGGGAIGGAIGGTGGAIAGGAIGTAAGLLTAAGPTNWVGVAIAGAVALGAVISTMFGNLRKQADEFIKATQGPFQDSIADISKALNAAKASGTLTVLQVTDASKAVKELWEKFQTSAEGAGVIGQQAMSHLGTFMETFIGDIDGLEAIAREMQLNAAAMDISKAVEFDREALDAMALALTRMHDAGTPTELIIDRLGSQIDELARSAGLSGDAIPPIITLYQQLAETAREVEAAQKRLPEVERELLAVREEVAQAMVAKVEFLEKQIGESRGRIQEWSDKITELNFDIKEAGDHLSDTTFWQDAYNDAIKEASDELQRATDQRKSIEDQIAALELQTQQDTLRVNLETANAIVAQTAEGSAARLAALANLQGAEAAMRQFDMAQQSAEREARLTELQRLQTALPEAIRQQNEAAAAFEAAKVAANASIVAQQQQLAVKIAADEATRQALLNSIATEQARIQALENDRASVLALMQAYGFIRNSEMQQLDANISAAIRRGQALEAERTSLTNLLGVAANSPDIFNALGQAFLNAAAAAVEAMANLSEADNGGNAVPWTGPFVMTGLNTGPNLGNDQQWLNPLNLGPGFKLPGFAEGGPVNRDMIAGVHAGEYIIPRGGELVMRDSGRSGSIEVNIGDVIVQSANGRDAMQLGQDIRREIVNGLQADGDFRRKVTELTTRR